MAAGTPESFDPRGEGWELLADAGFIGLVGPSWGRGEGSEAAFAFVAEPRHANLLGVVQGGMLMTFADRALGIGAWNAAGNRACATVQFDMQFVSSARMDDFVELRPEVVRRTTSLVFMQGSLRAGPRVVAGAHGVWKVLGER